MNIDRHVVPLSPFGGRPPDHLVALKKGVRIDNFLLIGSVRLAACFHLLPLAVALHTPVLSAHKKGLKPTIRFVIGSIIAACSFSEPEQ